MAIFLLRNNHTAVNSAVWTRGTVVALSALLTFTFTVRTARGSRRAYLRLRIISAAMVVAIAVIIALPGTFPLWMKVEQGISGLVLIGVAAVVNGEHLRRRRRRFVLSVVFSSICSMSPRRSRSTPTASALSLATPF